MTRSGRSNLTRSALGIAALAIAAFIGRRYFHELHRLTRVDLRIALAMGVLYLATRVLDADVLVASLAVLGHAIRRVEGFFLLIIHNYTNLLIPRAGMGATAAYLKLRRDVPVSDFVAVQVLPLFIVQMLAVGVAGLLSQWALLGFFGGGGNAAVAAVFAIVCVGCVALILIPSPRWRWGGRALAHFIGRLSGSYRALATRPALMARALTAQLLTMCLRAARVQLAFYAIGAPVNYFAAAVASLLSDLMIAISVTPGALGFREAAIIYAAGLLGTSGDVALSAALLDRIVVAACNIALAQVGLMWIVRPAFAARGVEQDVQPETVAVTSG
jgi:uncharacterized membrane protein YbhN (UPF0104 family)